MRIRRDKGEYRAKVRAYAETYFDAVAPRRVATAAVLGTLLAVIGAVGVLVLVSTIYRLMAPATIGEDALVGFWFAPLIVFWPFAPAVAAVIARQHHRIRWASWSALAAMVALPLGSYVSAGAYALGAAIALPLGERRGLRVRGALVATLALLGALAVALDRQGVSIALGSTAFCALVLSDRASTATTGTRRIGAAFVVVLGGVAAGIGVDVAATRVVERVAAPDGSAFMRPELRVCTGEVPEGCAQDAADRAGFAVAWLPDSAGVDPYGMFAIRKRGGPVERVLEEAAGRRGELISVESRPASTPTGTAVERRVDGLDVTLWIDDPAGGDAIEARWIRQGEAYGLSFRGHPLGNQTDSDLIGLATDLIADLRYVDPRQES